MTAPAIPNRRSRFKRIDLAGEKRRIEELAREVNGVVYNLFKEGIESFEFKEAKYYFRLLPQPVGALNTWSMTLPYIYVDPDQTPGHRGYIPFTIAQTQLMDTLRRSLYAHPTFGPLMAGEANRNGISLTVKYKSVFMGFCYNDPEPVVLPIVLPSNGFSKPKGRARLQVGTIISNFPFENDSAGAKKYGDIVDIDDGSLIGIEVVGVKDHREYVASVDRKFPIDASLEPLLDQVRPFEELVMYRPDEDIYTIARLRLTPAMWDYVVAKLQIPIAAAVITTETQRTSTAPATMGQPAVATVKPVTASAVPAETTIDAAQPVGEGPAPIPSVLAMSAEETLDEMSDEEIRERLRKRGLEIA